MMDSSQTLCMQIIECAVSGVSRVDQVDFVKESLLLEDLINKLTLNQPIFQPPAPGGGGYGVLHQQGAAAGDLLSSLPALI